MLGVQQHLCILDTCEASMGWAQVSSLERCPYFRGSFVHISKYVAGTVGTVLIREVSSFQR